MGGRGERERETRGLAVSHMHSDWAGLDPTTQCVPWTGLEPATLPCWGGALTTLQHWLGPNSLSKMKTWPSGRGKREPAETVPAKPVAPAASSQDLAFAKEKKPSKVALKLQETHRAPRPLGDQLRRRQGGLSAVGPAPRGREGRGLGRSQSRRPRHVPVVFSCGRRRQKLTGYTCQKQDQVQRVDE